MSNPKRAGPRTRAGPFPSRCRAARARAPGRFRRARSAARHVRFPRRARPVTPTRRRRRASPRRVVGCPQQGREQVRTGAPRKKPPPARTRHGHAPAAVLDHGPVGKHRRVVRLPRRSVSNRLPELPASSPAFRRPSLPFPPFRPIAARRERRKKAGSPHMQSWRQAGALCLNSVHKRRGLHRAPRSARPTPRTRTLTSSTAPSPARNSPRSP